jgi:hypothetical protein
MDDHRTQWSREATVPLLGGIIWLGSGLQAGWLALAISLLPGSLLMTAGVANLSWPGDARTRNLGAAAAIAGISTVPLLLFFVDPLVATGQIALCIAAAAALGRLALRSRTRAEGVPDAPLGFRASLESALDSAVLGGAILVAPPRGLHRSPVEAREEVEAARDLYRSRGWLEQPLTYHRNPPPLGKVELSPLRVSGFDVQHLRFESGYEPHLHEPGRDRYLGYAPCRTGHAWVLEHRGADRPWLICTHGYLMGGARLGLRAFPTAWLHRRLGLNLLLPVLPMHAQRKIHWMSGDGMLAANPLDTVHALAQTGWDLRRLLSWLLGRGAAQVGAFGLSLGGYSTALLAALEDGLSCAIAGVPVSDCSRFAWDHYPAESLRRVDEFSVGLRETRELESVVSPLVLQPRVERSRRYVFGGSADCLVSPEQVCDLWRHWDRPQIHWYPGSHVTFRLHPGVLRFVEAALCESGLTA